MERPLVLMILQTICFVAAWTAIDRRVSRHGPMPAARALNKAHSRLYSVASAALLYLTLSSGSDNDGLARLLYHASKFWEYVDVLTVRAGGGRIDLHFGFHHLTTPYLTFFRVLRDGEGWRAFAVANTAHHALMYAYFGGATSLRPVLDLTGFLQLAVGIGAEARLLLLPPSEDDVGGPRKLWPHLFAAGLLGSYLLLWAREMGMREAARGPARPKAKKIRYWLVASDV